MRKCVSLFLCVCLLAALLPIVSTTADAKTFSEVVAWMDSKKGKTLDYDGQYGGQCVDYFNYYLKEVWGISNPIGMYPVGSAYQIFDYNAPSGWTKISGSGNYRVGDVIIWNKSSSSQHGHVGIIYSVSGSTVMVSQQNYNKMQYVTVQKLHSTGTIRGVFRPPLQDDVVISAPTPGTTQNVLPGIYRLKNLGSGYYMNYAVGGLSGVSGYKPIIMSKPDDSPEQNFRFDYKGSGKYSLMITHSDGGAVNVYSSSGVGAGTPISQWSYSGSNYQQFYLTKVTGGYIIQSAVDSRFVIAPVNTDWHAQLKLAAYNENDKKQVWVLDQPSTLPFTDVSSDKYYWNALRWAYYTGICSGTSDTTFSPNKTCKREEVVTFLYAAAGKPSVSGNTSPFEDVKSGKYYYNAVLWAYYHNPRVASGSDATHFGVGKSCSREQVVTFLWNAKGAPNPKSTSTNFTDVQPGKYYYKAVLWAVENGITSGKTTTLFGVGETCTRAQIVTFLYAAYGK